jgi:hypothetical protein
VSLALKPISSGEMTGEIRLPLFFKKKQKKSECILKKSKRTWRRKSARATSVYTADFLLYCFSQIKIQLFTNKKFFYLNNCLVFKK